MKHHFSILFLIPVCLLFMACHHGDNLNKEEVLQSALEYFPYQEGDILIFYNATTGDTISMAAVSSDSENFLITHVDEIKGDPGWLIRVEAALTIGKLQAPNNKSFSLVNISDSYTSEMIQMRWGTNILFSKNAVYYASLVNKCKPEDIYNHFKDTIYLPVEQIYNGKTYENADKNAYVNIVKSRGITDFSLDGKTIWKRVK